jgi:hypothetical protein
MDDKNIQRKLAGVNLVFIICVLLYFWLGDRLTIPEIGAITYIGVIFGLVSIIVNTLLVLGID